MTERKENQMTTNRKVLTGLAVLIVLSLLVMPASAFAQGWAEGDALVKKVTKPWKVRDMHFLVAEKNGAWPASGSMWVHNAKCNNLLWSIPKVKCVTIANIHGDDYVFFGGRGRGKMRGKFVMVAAKHGPAGTGEIEVKTTRNKRRFNFFCNRQTPAKFGLRYRWLVDDRHVWVYP
jgi:hypothetical protein